MVQLLGDDVLQLGTHPAGQVPRLAGVADQTQLVHRAAVQQEGHLNTTNEMFHLKEGRKCFI